MTVKDIIVGSLNKKPLDVKNAFDYAIREKISASFDDIRKEVASNLFNGVTTPDEE